MTGVRAGRGVGRAGTGATVIVMDIRIGMRVTYEVGAARAGRSTPDRSARLHPASVRPGIGGVAAATPSVLVVRVTAMRRAGVTPQVAIPAMTMDPCARTLMAKRSV